MEYFDYIYHWLSMNVFCMIFRVLRISYFDTYFTHFHIICDSCDMQWTFSVIVWSVNLGLVLAQQPSDEFFPARMDSFV